MLLEPALLFSFPLPSSLETLMCMRDIERGTNVTNSPFWASHWNRAQEGKQRFNFMFEDHWTFGGQYSLTHMRAVSTIHNIVNSHANSEETMAMPFLHRAALFGC
jgi:hypothetical protein